MLAYQCVLMCDSYAEGDRQFQKGIFYSQERIGLVLRYICLFERETIDCLLADALLQDARQELRIPAALVADAVAVAVACEDHVAGVQHLAFVIVRDHNFAFQDIVNLRIRKVRVLLDLAPRRNVDDVEHIGLVQHFGRRQNHFFVDNTGNVALVFDLYGLDFIFMLNHIMRFLKKMTNANYSQ